jgi:glycosyltransferase involved in cell wall biosynthesis
MSVAALRILHVVPYYEQAWAYGGIPRLATTMTRALARRGHHVTVCTTDVRDERSRTPRSSGSSHGVEVRIFRNVSNRLAYHLQFFTPVGLRKHLRINAASFDIAHLHACHNLPGTLAAAAFMRAGVPFVVSPNGTGQPIERRVLAKRIFAATAGRHVLRGAARVLAVTDVEQEQLVALGVPRSHISVVPNPLDDDEDEADAGTSKISGETRFRGAHRIGDARIVLFLGKLTPRKGVLDLLRAYARLNRPDTVLVIAGNDMGTGPAADALVASLGLQARVIRTGLLRDTDRLDALRAAAVVVYPSRDEIFGLVPLEALLCGTPVVVCGDSGCGEVIGKVGGGLIVPPGEPSTLSQAIRLILDEPSQWRSLADAAATRARSLFGADVVCEALEHVYADVCRATAADRKPA